MPDDLAVSINLLSTAKSDQHLLRCARAFCSVLSPAPNLPAPLMMCPAPKSSVMRLVLKEWASKCPFPGAPASLRGDNALPEGSTDLGVYLVVFVW
jgi:hypothetical protein